jgi:hypothetical protein
VPPPRRPVTPVQINSFDDPYNVHDMTGQGMMGMYDPRMDSAQSGIYV